jgi:radical SAM-linked protein
MRFLSHAETLRVWQRACTRAVLPLQYSQGFNPHPRLSLPLPRPVGVVAQEELLVAKLCEDPEGGPAADRIEREAAMKHALAEQLPEGIEVLAVDLVAAHASLRPQSAEYVLPLEMAEESDAAEGLRDRIARVMDSDRCLVERTSTEGRATKTVDVRPFLQAIRWEGGDLIVQHRTGGAGSIRVEEILRLFGLPPQDLTGPVRRTNVIWETTNLDEVSEEPCQETRAEDLEDGT